MTRLKKYFMRGKLQKPKWCYCNSIDREIIMMNRKFRNMSMFYIYKLINVFVIYTGILSL